MTFDRDAAIRAERTALADLLEGLSPQDWEAPSLCPGWRVREVVAHITMPFRYSVPRFAWEMARSRGRFDAMSDRTARRDGAVGPTVLLAGLRANVGHPWNPPGGGRLGALTHDVVHTLDVTIPLGLDPALPQDVLVAVLDSVCSPRALRHHGLSVTGIRLLALDVPWSHGEGPVVDGAATDLVSFLNARILPPGRVHGASLASVRTRPAG